MNTLYKVDDCCLTQIDYDESWEAKDKLYELMFKWFTTNGAYSGEIIWQSDNCMERAPEILTEIAEKVFKFHVEYDYDDEEEEDKYQAECDDWADNGFDDGEDD